MIWSGAGLVVRGCHVMVVRFETFVSRRHVTGSLEDSTRANDLQVLARK